MMTATTRFSRGRVAHGPSTARSLQRRTTKIVELGRRMPASAAKRDTRKEVVSEATSMQSGDI